MGNYHDAREEHYAKQEKFRKSHKVKDSNSVSSSNLPKRVRELEEKVKTLTKHMDRLLKGK